MMEPRERAICRITTIGAWVNAGLSCVKLGVGLLGQSSAMVADAVHSFSDFATDLAVLLFVRVAARPSDEDHDFGHGKFETLASVLIGVALLGVGAGIVLAAWKKMAAVLWGGDVTAPSWVAWAAALVSIGVKEVLYRVTRRVGERTQSTAVVANAWHHRSDAISSVGTLLGIGGAYFLGGRWILLDPIAACAVGILIIKVSIELVKPGVEELLEKSLPKSVEDEILAIVTEDPAVKDPHNLRTRRVGVEIVAQVHVRVDGTLTVAAAHALTERIEARMRQRFGSWAHLIVHVEPLK